MIDSLGLMYFMKIFFVVALNKESDVIRFFVPSRYTTPATAKFVSDVCLTCAMTAEQELSQIIILRVDSYCRVQK